MMMTTTTTRAGCWKKKSLYSSLFSPLPPPRLATKASATRIAVCMLVADVGPVTSRFKTLASAMYNCCVPFTW